MIGRHSMAAMAVGYSGGRTLASAFGGPELRPEMRRRAKAWPDETLTPAAKDAALIAMD